VILQLTSHHGSHINSAENSQYKENKWQQHQEPRDTRVSLGAQEVQEPCPQ